MAEYCIGTAQFGMPYGIANNSGQPEIGEIQHIVQTAIDNDIQYFDTAQSYGESEEFLGKAIKKIPDQKNIKIISKLSPDLNYHNSSEIIQSVKSSLMKLNMNSLYGFLAHRIEAINTESFSVAIKTLKKEGLVIKTGVSVYSPEEAISVLNRDIVDILQIPFNILDKRWIDEGVIEKAIKNNVQLFFRSIFLQGLIFLNKKDLYDKKMEWAVTHMHQFNDIVNRRRYSSFELTFGILNKVPGKNVIIMGLENNQQLHENLNTLKKIDIDQKEYDNWWSTLPQFPEKLLNPSLWN